MDNSEVLKFVDELVYNKTGKHLNDLQRGIIEGTLKHQKYSDIAKNYNCSTGHTKEVGYELWRLLSKIFNETVDKKHLKSILERQINQNIIFTDININSNILGSGCIINNSDRPHVTPNTNQSVTPDFPQKNNHQIKKEKLDKLRQYGLNDEEIADILELPLAIIKQISLEE